MSGVIIAIAVILVICFCHISINISLGLIWFKRDVLTVIAIITSM